MFAISFLVILSRDPSLGIGLPPWIFILICCLVVVFRSVLRILIFRVLSVNKIFIKHPQFFPTVTKMSKNCVSYSTRAKYAPRLLAGQSKDENSWRNIHWIWWISRMANKRRFEKPITDLKFYFGLVLKISWNNEHAWEKFKVVLVRIKFCSFCTFRSFRSFGCHWTFCCHWNYCCHWNFCCHWNLVAIWN